MSRPLRSMVVVGGPPHWVENLRDLFVDTNDYDVIVMESIARGYSRIKQVTPDFVIVLMAIDDVAACQLLSMLKIDRDVSSIPLATCAMRGDERERKNDNAAIGNRITGPRGRACCSTTNSAIGRALCARLMEPRTLSGVLCIGAHSVRACANTHTCVTACQADFIRQPWLAC
jgi:hypothetical protein